MKMWLEKLHLDLKVNWKLSRNQTTFKENFIVHLDTNEGVFKSEIAPNIRYGESIKSIHDEFQMWVSHVDLKSLNSISDVENSLNIIKISHALSFGLESVLLSYLAHKDHQSLSTFLKLPQPKSVATSFSMPILPIGEIADYLSKLKRFKSLKIKIDAQSGEAMLQEIRKHTEAKLLIDANEGWKDLDAFIRFQETLRGMNIELIEQPFPSTMVEEYKTLKKLTQYKLLADESIEAVGDFSELKDQFHAVNIKLMKTGSLLRAKELIESAKAHQMQVMMGCMIETSIGISYGMLFSGLADYVDLDGFLLIKDEPFHLVSETEGILSLA